MANAAASSNQGDENLSFIAHILEETAEKRRARLAKELINTKFAPPGFTAHREMRLQAGSYHSLMPYPYWHFQDWKTEDRGPLPRCMPFVRSIIRKGAKWLFGKPIQITVPGEKTDKPKKADENAKSSAQDTNAKKLESFYRKAWQLNRMPTRMVAAAEIGGVQGGVVLKWHYDETAETKLSFQILSAVDQCRLFYDPHDRDSLLMARIQYPVFNPCDGQYYLYREEWTDAEEIHYLPVKARFQSIYTTFQNRSIEVGTLPVIDSSGKDPDNYDDWQITGRGANRFGVIPMQPIRNVDVEETWGIGDLWASVSGGMYRVVDRVNLARHLMDWSNQFDSMPNIVFIDADMEEDDAEKPIAPGQNFAIKTANGEMGENRQADAKLLETKGAMRPHLRDYAEDVKRELLHAVGSVEPNEAEITNKGNLTQAVLTQLYAPLIEATEEKRKTYGEDGICKFLERCTVGLTNLGIKNDDFPRMNLSDPESYDIQLMWADYFELTENEKQVRIVRIDTEVQGGYLDHERAIEIVAKTEDIEDVQALKEALKDEIDRRDTMKTAEADTAVGMANQALNPPKPNTPN